MNKYIFNIIILLIISIFLIAETNASSIDLINKKQTKQYLTRPIIEILENDITWMKTYGSIFHSDEGYSVDQTNDGGYIIIGRGIGVIKLNADGKIEWEKSMNIVNNVEIKQTNDGGYIITLGYVPMYEDIYVLMIKIDSEGNTKWSNRYDNCLFGGENTIQQTNDGGYILCCTRSDSHEKLAWLVKTDINGLEQWNTTFKYYTFTYGRSVKQTIDGGFIIAGSSNGSMLIKTDSYGNEEWNSIFKDSTGGRSVYQTADGGYALATYDCNLIKTDSYGNEKWMINIPNEVCNVLNSMDYIDHEGFIVTGEINYPETTDLSLVKIDENGIIEWHKSFGKNLAGEAGYCVRQTIDSGFIIIGYNRDIGVHINYPVPLLSDVWLIKTDNMGNAEKINTSYPIINMI